MSAAGTQSVLEMMAASTLDQATASVINQKIKAGAKLTPVGLEAATLKPAPVGLQPAGSPGPVLPTTRSNFPLDVPDEAITGAIALVRAQIDRIAEADRIIHSQWAVMLDALGAAERALGHTEQADAAAAEAAAKQKEMAADAAARERHAATVAAVALANAAEADDDELPAPESPFAQLGEQIISEAQASANALTAEVLARMDQKAAEAQAATFTPLQPTDSGWQCPVHKVSIEKTSRLGRTYRACNNADCKQFEKL